MTKPLIARVIDTCRTTDHGTYENWIANIVTATLTEAAKVARNFRRWGQNRDHQECADEIAKAILALKDKETSE